MSKKYIKQTNSYNFIYPNNTVPEYDVEIIHNINDNAPTGTISSVSVSGVTISGMTLHWSGVWNLNDAEPFVQDNGSVSTISLHGMGPTQQYFKPFRLLEDYTTTSGTTTVTYTNQILSLTPSMFGLTSFTNGTYNFEFRLVSKRAVLPICGSVVVSGLNPPTPTPTSTPTLTPTPTPTPTSSPTPTPTGPTPTPTPVPSYNLYLADEYLCTFPGCALQRTDVVVALPTSATPNYGKFYPDIDATGFAYLLTTTTSGGPGIILNLANFTACSSACSV
jgi:hypothetical protein